MNCDALGSRARLAAVLFVCLSPLACESEHMISDGVDSAVDASTEDSGTSSDADVIDIGFTDAGFADLGVIDAGLGDAGLDDSGPQDAGPIDSGVDCVANAKRVFVTSAVYTGKLTQHAGLSDGLEAGDALCTLHANAANLGGTWRAWLSSTSTDAIDHLDDVGPWYLVDRCTKVTNNLSTLVVNGPSAGIRLTEAGEVPAPRNTWTGTEPTGRADSFTCNDWTNDQPVAGYEGTVGSPSSTDGFWTQIASNPCRLEARLYCFEQ